VKTATKLVSCFDWAATRTALNFIQSDSVAVVTRGQNCLGWLPVFLRESDNAPHVRIDGDWIPVDGLQFLRFEKVRTKKLYNTAQDKLVERI